jgi:hypothetical protein
MLMPNSRLVFDMLLNLMKVDKVGFFSIIYAVNLGVYIVLTCIINRK